MQIIIATWTCVLMFIMEQYRNVVEHDLTFSPLEIKNRREKITKIVTNGYIFYALC